MYKGMWINILTALIGLCVTFLIGGGLLPVLKRLRFISDGADTDNSGDRLPISGGVMLCTGIFVSSAAGYLAMRFFSDSFDYQGENTAAYFVGQLAMLAAFAVGFYSDFLQSRGKKGGISEVYTLLSNIIISAAFLIILFVKAEADTKITIPFVGEKDLGYAYYPTMLAVMTVICCCFSAADKRAGAAPAAYAVFSVGAMSVFSGLSLKESGILSAASAGSAMGFLVWNYPAVKILGGRCGSMLMGMGAAVMTVSSGKTVYMLIMLIPVLIDGICTALKLHSSKTETRKAADAAVIIFRYFLFSLIAVIAALLLSEEEI